MDTPSPDRYRVDGFNAENQYVDDSERILVNKLGIKNLGSVQQKEEQGLAHAYATLIPSSANLDKLSNAEIYRAHAAIFGELYEWAGRNRTVNISKEGVSWAAPQFIQPEMKKFQADVLDRHPVEELQDRKQFTQGIAEIQGEFLSIHPFREGNARTIKLATDLLAVSKNRPLLAYDTSTEGQRRYIAAASHALHKQDYRPLESEIDRALEIAEVRDQAYKRILEDVRKNPSKPKDQEADRDRDDDMGR